MRSEADSNRCTRFCRPLPSHSAIRPFPYFGLQIYKLFSNLQNLMHFSANISYFCGMKLQNNDTEHHPLEPFLPEKAKILMLGSFPPQRKRWSMEFFYPNVQNDMWRIMGAIFHNDKHFFEILSERRFDREAIINFCTAKGIALYDTAVEVRRLKDNASDKFLDIVTPTDINSLLNKIPDCQAIITTGQRATDVVCELSGCAVPTIGSFSEIKIGNHSLRFWRMPSSSRAYPLALEKKADFYRIMLQHEGLL